jgi:hypothetical protein
MSRSLGLLVAVVALGAGCSEYVIDEPDPPATAAPPGIDPDADFGQPPDWQTCTTGYYGQYFNLTTDDPVVEPDPDADPPGDPTTLDWWSIDRLAWRDFDGTLDIGANWWPVDQGLEGDPAYFTVRWTAWLRAWSGTTLSFTFGSADDAWVILNGTPIGALPGIHDFEPETVEVNVNAGQYPIDLRYAHRGSEVSGFRFRVVEGDVSICYPDFSEE